MKDISRACRSEHWRNWHQIWSQHNRRGDKSERASSRRVTNEVISQPLLLAELCPSKLRPVAVWGAVRADVLLGVEQRNEQQAEVRDVAPTTLPSDYHTETDLCVHSSSGLSDSVCVPRAAEGNSCLVPSQTHTHTHNRTCAPVMRSQESKLEKSRHCTLSGVKRGRNAEVRKVQRWGREGRRRWRAGLPVCIPPGTVWYILFKRFLSSFFLFFIFHIQTSQSMGSQRIPEVWSLHLMPIQRNSH